ncbi:hypothetical protein BT96DRAFT_1007394 [Gymnopus androsaceus JB14]|uniref:Uncharacterized protein n=1 Tax=Gymnopus androsaceus JB14 TaxID=1447944 RepID=A0A6A4GHW9_9AGAR|nr:hypothetical protein BT96DRAFT_1007394 [Gymnopus androsaceus JB14]
MLRLYLKLASPYAEDSPKHMIHEGVRTLIMSFLQEDPAVYAGDQNPAPSRDVLAKFMAESMKFDHPLVDWPKGAIGAFIDFIENSRNSLKTLSLRDLSVNPMLPNLQKLYLHIFNEAEFDVDVLITS